MAYPRMEIPSQPCSVCKDEMTRGIDPVYQPGLDPLPPHYDPLLPPAPMAGTHLPAELPQNQFFPMTHVGPREFLRYLVIESILTTILM
jgi:hypothetical protein